MALIKCPECGREVSNKATSCPNCGYGINCANGKRSPKSNKKWIVILICVFALLACGAGAWLIFSLPDTNAVNSDEPIVSANSKPTEVQQTPDLTLFEVSGNVKEICSWFRSPLPILNWVCDGKPILFTNKGEWNTENLENIEKIKRNADGQMIEILGTTIFDTYENPCFEWGNGHVIKIENYDFGGRNTTLEYHDNNLVAVQSIPNDVGLVDDRYKFTLSYKLKDVKTDNNGNWVQRIWEVRYSSYNSETGSYSANPEYSEEIESRIIIYWE